MRERRDGGRGLVLPMLCEGVLGTSRGKGYVSYSLYSCVWLRVEQPLDRVSIEKDDRNYGCKVE